MGAFPAPGDLAADLTLIGAAGTFRQRLARDRGYRPGIHNVKINVTKLGARLPSFSEPAPCNRLYDRQHPTRRRSPWTTPVQFDMSHLVRADRFEM
jgi:hypothetical protein